MSGGRSAREDWEDSNSGHPDSRKQPLMGGEGKRSTAANQELSSRMEARKGSKRGHGIRRILTNIPTGRKKPPSRMSSDKTNKVASRHSGPRSQNFKEHKKGKAAA